MMPRFAILHVHRLAWGKDEIAFRRWGVDERQFKSAQNHTICRTLELDREGGFSGAKMRVV